MDTSLAQHVERASEAIRAANHASLGPVTGPDAYAVVGSLAELVHRVPQLLDFLSRGLRRVAPPSTTTTAAPTRQERSIRPTATSFVRAPWSTTSPTTSTTPIATSATSATTSRRTEP